MSIVLSIAGGLSDAFLKVGSVGLKGASSGMRLAGRGIGHAAGSIGDYRAERKDQRTRLIEAAYLHADSTSKEDLQKWMKKTFNSNDAFDFLEGHNKIKISEKDILKHLDGISKKDRKVLIEQRGETLRDNANDYFKTHNLIRHVAKPRDIEGKEESWSLKGLCNAFGNAIDNIKANRALDKDIKLEQTERLLAMAHREAAGTKPSDIRKWLEDVYKRDEAKFYVDASDDGLKVNLEDMQKAYAKMQIKSPDYIKDMVDARQKYLKGDSTSHTSEHENTAEPA